GAAGGAVLEVETSIEAEVVALELHELEVTGPRGDFDGEVARAERDARAGRVADPGPARALYRRFDVDPTRHRPSSEALLRRVRRGGGAPPRQLSGRHRQRRVPAPAGPGRPVRPGPRRGQAGGAPGPGRRVLRGDRQ